MRRIPDDNLAYPVLVVNGRSTGSGFFLNTSPATFLVSARHVLYDPDTSDFFAPEALLTSYPRNPADTSKNVFKLDLRLLESAGHLKSDPVQDLVTIRVGTAPADAMGGRMLSSTSGISVEQIAPSGILGVAETGIKLYREVSVANEVYLFGYPVSLGIPNMPQLDYSRPLLRSGIVAGKNETLRTIILDCAAYPGNSGGPVVEIEEEAGSRTLKVIGVVTQFVPTMQNIVGALPVLGLAALGNSGYSVVASIDEVLRLVQQY
jgi:hypothetical protein